MLTFLGAQDSQEGFIRGELDGRIHPIFLFMDHAPTIVKRRFVEIYPLQKMFEVYVMNDIDENPANSQALCARMKEILPAYDVVIVTDYGHGMLEPEAVDILCEQARFLAVNTQVNAANHGFNTVSKYHRADYISVSENEIRLEARNRRRDLREIVSEVAEKLACKRVTVTRGEQGCLCYSEEDGFFEVPAFARNVVDRVGAGDALLVMTALCVVQNAPMEVVGFIGNAAAAQVVATVGHRSPIKRASLFNHIESLFK
jgi:bifunctional ADP-heptose synthase (sugar kinase/adenylyltransferase)